MSSPLIHWIGDAGVNILFCSVPFRPSIGGIETVSLLLAERFERLGQRVALVTRTESVAPDVDPFSVVRGPSPRYLLELARWADLVFHNNISLRLAWPLLLVQKPWVVAHHTWLPGTGAAARAKRTVLRHATNIAVSRAIADSLPVPSSVIPNPYADDTFKPLSGIARRGELAFVGRLVSDKGVSILLDALTVLARRGRRVRLTVIGEGPEGPALKAQAEQLGLAAQVAFVGQRTGPELAAALNAHQVLVVPSVWEEPFGVVALEAIACGCVPLVTQRGGLPEAVGAAGLIVPRAEPDALADGIHALLGDSARLDSYRAAAAAHLARHTRDQVARDYLRIFDDAHRTHGTKSAARVA